MSVRIKYPRTYHLPNSPGCTSDDKILSDVCHLLGREVVITEKMDGENITIYSDGYIHARSIDGRHHPSRDWVKKIASEIFYYLPPDSRVCGENLYAKHSIAYYDLESYFLGFSFWIGTKCQSWDVTKKTMSIVGIETVPVIYRGILSSEIIDDIASELDTSTQEGFVIRLADEFDYGDFSKSVAKWVRLNHVNTDEHWMNNVIVPNSLAK